MDRKTFLKSLLLLTIPKKENKKDDVVIMGGSLKIKADDLVAVIKSGNRNSRLG